MTVVEAEKWARFWEYPEPVPAGKTRRDILLAWNSMDRVEKKFIQHYIDQIYGPSVWVSSIKQHQV